MRHTDSNASGSSFFGEYINCSLKVMRLVLGVEDSDFVSGDDKVQHEWIRETDNGDVVTFYDYKIYRTITDDEIISWHIGGYNKQSCVDARLELEELMVVHIGG